MEPRTWHILRVVTGTEISTARALGLPCYVPHRLHKSYNRRQRRVTRSYRPALPGLIFVRVEHPRSINTIRTGVVGWMRDGSRAYIGLSDAELRATRDIETNFWLADDTPETLPSPFRPGDAVRFTSRSLLSGYLATVLRLKGNSALYELVNGTVVEAPLDDRVQLVA